MKFAGVCSNPADGPVGVGEWGWMVILWREPTSEHAAGDPLLDSPVGDLLSFEVLRQRAVAATRADDDGDVGFLIRDRFPDPKDRRVGGLRAHRARSAIRPKSDLARVGRFRQRRRRNSDNGDHRHETKRPTEHVLLPPQDVDGRCW